ncbi:MAG: hypothetical protein ABIJ65_13975 [Chloroflexota bacterium]
MKAYKNINFFASSNLAATSIIFGQQEVAYNHTGDPAEEPAGGFFDDVDHDGNLTRSAADRGWITFS